MIALSFRQFIAHFFRASSRHSTWPVIAAIDKKGEGEKDE